MRETDFKANTWTFCCPVPAKGNRNLPCQCGHALHPALDTGTDALCAGSLGSGERQTGELSHLSGLPLNAFRVCHSESIVGVSLYFPGLKEEEAKGLTSD
jgi:hypothetical protein